MQTTSTAPSGSVPRQLNLEYASALQITIVDAFVVEPPTTHQPCLETYPRTLVKRRANARFAQAKIWKARLLVGGRALRRVMSKGLSTIGRGLVLCPIATDRHGCRVARSSVVMLPASARWTRVL